jgi:hypothetical protein
MFHIQCVNYDAWKGFESFKHVMTLERYQIVDWHLYVKTEQNVIFNIVSFLLYGILYVTIMPWLEHCSVEMPPVGWCFHFGMNRMCM